MNEDKINKIQDVIAKELPSTSNVEVLSRRLHRVTGLSEETSKLIAQEWKKGVGTLAVALLVVFLFNQYQSSVKRKAEESTLALSNIQAQYSILTASADNATPDSSAEDKNTKENPDAQTIRERAAISFRDNLSLLMRHKTNGNYQDLALVYGAVEKLQSGDISGAKSVLQKEMRVALGSSLTEATPSRRISGSELAQELAKLLLVKASLLEADSNLAQIKEQLIQVAYESQLVTVEAIVTLFRLSSSAEDRARANEVMNKVIVARPELNDILQSEAKSFGII